MRAYFYPAAIVFFCPSCYNKVSNSGVFRTFILQEHASHGSLKLIMNTYIHRTELYPNG